MLEKPYQLYLKDYNEMQDEHDTYLKATNELKLLGYKTPEQIESLEKIKSNIEDRLSTNDLEIRVLRKDIRSCNNALELNQHIKNKMQGLQKIEKANELKKLTAKEMARNLLER